MSLVHSASPHLAQQQQQQLQQMQQMQQQQQNQNRRKEGELKVEDALKYLDEVIVSLLYFTVQRS
jgi:hypothetical protein